MESKLDNLQSNYKRAEKTTEQLFRLFKKTKPANLDLIAEQIHNRVFEKTNCLECANCCKTTGPLFTQKDITRISKHFRQRPAQFVSKYLHIDEDGDYVLNFVPCTFLSEDNSCSIYDIRPQACREYPHTNRKQFHKILDITLKNTAICPAAFEIVEEMKKLNLTLVK